jgi:hypothetical protein
VIKDADKPLSQFLITTLPEMDVSVGQGGGQQDKKGEKR